MDPDQRDGAEARSREIAFWRAVDESMLAGLTVVGLDGVQAYVNRAFAELVGFSREELVGAAPPFLYWPPEDRARIEEAFAATLRGEAPREGFELRFCRRSGERFDVLVLTAPLTGEGGEPMGWVGTVFDITARKEAELRVRESEGLLHLAHAVGRMGAWQWRMREGEVVWSPELAGMLGTEAGSLAGSLEAFEAHIHPDDRARVHEALERAARAPDEELHAEYRALREDGSVLWLESRGRVVPDDPSRMVGVASDVTERRRLEDRRRLLADASALLAVTLDPQETLRKTARLAVPRLADLCVVHLLDDAGELRLVEVTHVDPVKGAMARAYEERWPTPADAPIGPPVAIRERRALLERRVSPEHLARAAHSSEHLETISTLLPRSAIVVPLEARGRVLGAITLVTDESGRDYDEDDLELARNLAARAALAVDNARLFAEAERARFEAERAARRLKVLADATDAMASALDDDAALTALAEVAVEDMADYCVTYAYDDAEGSVRRVGLAHRDPDKRPLVARLVDVGPPRITDAFGAGLVIRTGEPVVLPEISDASYVDSTQDEAHARVLRQLAPRSNPHRAAGGARSDDRCAGLRHHRRLGPPLRRGRSRAGERAGEPDGALGRQRAPLPRGPERHRGPRRHGGCRLARSAQSLAGHPQRARGARPGPGRGSRVRADRARGRADEALRPRAAGHHADRGGAALAGAGLARSG